MSAYLYAYAAFSFGVVAGVFTIALCRAAREPLDIELDADADLLDHLDDLSGSLLFNDTVDGGSWGLLDHAGNLVAVGRTPRDALVNARARTAEASNG